MPILQPEWAPQDAVLLSWPHKDTDWNYMLDEVTACYVELATQLSRRARLLIVAPDVSVPQKLLSHIPGDIIVYLQAPTNDTWARDFGMLCTIDASGQVNALDFKFNGWGLKFAADKDNLINRAIFGSDLIGEKVNYVNCLNFVLEGGSIDIDEDGVLLTTAECLLSPNRNGASTVEEIGEALMRELGCRGVAWLQNGALEGDDTDSHVDTLARFLPDGFIAYASCDRPDDSHYICLAAMEAELRDLRRANGEPYKLVPLPIPGAIYDEDGQRLPATYANFLLLNGALFLPVYGDAKYDSIAVERLSRALPGYEIVPIDCRALIRQHGSLHCVTIQLPAGVLK